MSQKPALPPQFPHYMLKEIYDQPVAIAATISNFSTPTGLVIPQRVLDEIPNLEHLVIVASGASRHAGLAGEFMFERLAALPTEVDFASQYCYRDPIVEPHELTIFITQSGTTADTIAALEEARSKGSHTLVICNVFDAPITREADAVLYTNAGAEISIAATKSFTTQLTALYLLAAYFSRVKQGTPYKHDAALESLPEACEATLKTDLECQAWAAKLKDKDAYMFLGRDIDYTTSLEGALKLKETSYIHAEGIATGEMKHGPRALLDEEMPVIVIATCDEKDPASVVRFDRTLSILKELGDRGVHVYAITSKGNGRLDNIASGVIEIPTLPVLLQPVLSIIPLQLLAYRIAVLRGVDVDHPRNLSKSVVVE